MAAEAIPAAVTVNGRGSDQLGRRTARGAAVTLIGQGARIFLQTASILVLARILRPVDYGLMAMVLVVVGLGEILRDFGLSTAAIQVVHLSDAQRNALFWINTGIGVALSIAVFASADLVAGIFGHPAIAAMIRVLSVTFTLNGIGTQFRADLNRELRFVALSAADVIGQAVALIVAVVAGVMGAGRWALVGQQISQVAVALVLLIVFSRWLPGRPRRGSEVGALVRMGGHLMITQMVYYLFSNLDTIVIGLRFSSSALGTYNRGYQLVMNPLNQLRSPATSVALPVLSRLQNDDARFAEYVKRGQLAMGYTMIPFLAIGAGASRPVVELLLGHRWIHSAPIFSFLACAGTFSTLAFVGSWVYISRGLARDLLRYTMVSLVLQFVCIVAGSSWGITGVAAGFAFAGLLEWPLSLWWLSRVTVIPAGGLLSGAGRILACAMPAGGLSFLASRGASGGGSALAVLAALGAGGAVYLGAFIVSKPVRRDLTGVAGFFRNMVGRDGSSGSRSTEVRTYDQVTGRAPQTSSLPVTPRRRRSPTPNRRTQDVPPGASALVTRAATSKNPTTTRSARPRVGGADRVSAAGLALLLPVHGLAHAGVTASFALALLSIPLWLPSAARYRGGLALLIVGLAATLWGFVLSWTAAADGFVVDSSFRHQYSLTLASIVVGIGVLLWAREVLALNTLAAWYGLGMLVNAGLSGGHTDNAWKFTWAVPVSVTVLALTSRRGRTAPPLLALVVLAVVSIVLDCRSYSAALALSAILLMWRATRRASGRRPAWVVTTGYLALLAIGVYYLATSLLVAGYLGSNQQARTIAQIQTSGSVILGGRPEISATWALMRYRPGGYGFGVVPQAADIDAAKTGMAGIGYNPNNGYVENFMFGGHIELHSVVGDLWAQCGLVGLALVGLLVFVLVRSVSTYIAHRTGNALLLFLCVWMLWNVAFSPLEASMSILVLAAALVVPRSARASTYAPPSSVLEPSVFGQGCA